MHLEKNMSAIFAVRSQSNIELLKELLQVLAGSFLIGLCAQIAIPLPFTPVPITGQTFAIMLLGVLLGSRRGACAVLFYLAEITMGMPVLAGGAVAPLALIGPRGGYLLGMVLQAFLAGKCVERGWKQGKLFVGLMLTCALELACGAIFLANFVGLSNVFFMGVLPFIPGEIIKSLLVSGYDHKGQ